MQFLFLKSHVLDITAVLQGQTETAQVDLVPGQSQPPPSTAGAPFSPSPQVQGFHPRNLWKSQLRPPLSIVGWGSRPGVPGPRPASSVCSLKAPNPQSAFPPLALFPQPPDRFLSPTAHRACGCSLKVPVVQIQRFHQGSAEQRAGAISMPASALHGPRSRLHWRRPFAQGGPQCPQVEESKWGLLPVTGCAVCLSGPGRKWWCLTSWAVQGEPRRPSLCSR